MKTKLLIIGGVVAVVGFSVWDIAQGPDPYFAQVQVARKAKNSAFRGGNESPLTAAQRPQFDSLKYFAPDKKYVVTAQYAPLARLAPVAMQMTDRRTEPYTPWGRATFDLNGQRQQLTLFRKTTDSTLFVPFADASNGRETYGGGRYLDAAVPAEGATTIVLDFNRAYNPYCAYNNGYSCPVPPAENRLTAPVLAGEKTFHD
ncbi:DUF1684 domain-containing protein [Hymenobacter nivis]|uniref:DUF1684 domain-containing protein n=1 Tax=Hymenobacter nivis TaxID=1850093 RepID=A0A2Z3GZE5_9BACT|nr:DUF1684 domain-containing protein [Hymenobacter nivis]AWM34744.1 DUF1684 domain-containing protein [Hymenobacter nivis]